MTPEQMTQALGVVQKVLTAIAQDTDWIALSSDERARPDLATDLGDAQHYASELAWKIEAEAGRDLPAFQNPSPDEEEAINKALTQVCDALLALLFREPPEKSE